MQGEKVKKNELDELYIHDAKYTTCNLADPHFHIATKKLKVIPGKKVISGPFHLKFGNVPTPLGFIFGMFPQPKETVSGISTFLLKYDHFCQVTNKFVINILFI